MLRFFYNLNEFWQCNKLLDFFFFIKYKKSSLRQKMFVEWIYKCNMISFFYYSRLQ